MSRCLRSALCVLLVLVAWPVVAGEPAAPPSLGPKHAEFVKIFEQWKVTLAKLRQLRDEYPKANGSRKLEIQRQYQELVQEGEKQEPALLEAALAAFQETPTDADLTNFLVGVIEGEYRHDQYENVLRLVKPLLDQGLAEKHRGLTPLYTWGGQAAFAMGEWNLAEEYLKKALERRDAEENREITQRNAGYVSLLPYYREAWPKEQQIREAEAKANDLPRVLLKTNKGDIVLELFENEAPNTVANFISLVEKGFYNGLTFHRVLPAFMAQGGDPAGNGTGGTNHFIPCECYEPNHRLHFRGTLSMAHAGRDTGSSQFFLTFIPTQGLDGKHTAFGRVIEGMEVLGKIQRRDPDKPDSAAMEPDKIVEAKVLRKRNHPYQPKTLEIPPRMRAR